MSSNFLLTNWPTDWLMHSDKHNLIMTIATGLISSLINVASSRDVPFHQPQQRYFLEDTWISTTPDSAHPLLELQQSSGHLLVHPRLCQNLCSASTITWTLQCLTVAEHLDDSASLTSSTTTNNTSWVRFLIITVRWWSPTCSAAHSRDWSSLSWLRSLLLLTWLCMIGQTHWQMYNTTSSSHQAARLAVVSPSLC